MPKLIDFRCELSEMEKFKQYLAENGLEVAGLADWIPDPKHPGRKILGVPVRPVQQQAAGAMPAEKK